MLFDSIFQNLHQPVQRVHLFFEERKPKIDVRNANLLKGMLPLYTVFLLLLFLFGAQTAMQKYLLGGGLAAHIVFSAAVLLAMKRKRPGHKAVLGTLSAFAVEVMFAAVVVDMMGDTSHGVLVFPLALIMLTQVYLVPPAYVFGGLAGNMALFILVGTRCIAADVFVRDCIEMILALGLAVLLYESLLYHRVIFHEEQKRLQYLCIHDPLTGVYNVSAFERLYQEQYVGGLHFFAIVDMDNFKSINDSKGHTMGDRVLMVLSAALKEQAEQQFSRSLVGRFGGDEFLIAAEGFADAEDVKTRLSAMQTAVCARMEQSFHAPITFSMGVVVCHSGEMFREVFGQADREMYRAKAAGAHTFCVVCADENTSTDAVS